MPSRMIHERACDSPTLAVLSSDAERLWWRLLTTTDSVGLFVADPRVVAGKCVAVLEWSGDLVATLLQEMEQAGLVVLYSVEGRQYGRVVTFSKHNRIHSCKPKYPPPTLSIPCPRGGDTLSPGSNCHARPSDTLVDSRLSLPLYSSEPQTRDPSTPNTAAVPPSTESLSRARAALNALTAWKPDHRLALRWTDFLLRTWAADIEALHSVDGRSWERIDRVIAALPTMRFWPSKIFGDSLGAKLREKFDQLEAEITDESRPKNERPAAPCLKTPDELAAADPAEAERLAEFRSRYNGGSR